MRAWKVKRVLKTGAPGLALYGNEFSHVTYNAGTPTFLLMCLGKPWKMAQDLAPALTWETQTEFQPSGFSLAQTWL